MKKGWKEIFKLGASYDISKKDVILENEFKPYKVKGNPGLPNNAKFDGDRFPEDGDAASNELEAWKAQNKQFIKNKKSESDDTSHGSSILMKKKVETLDEQMKNPDHVFPNLDAKKVEHEAGWREVFADVSVEKKPDGTVKVNVDEGFNQTPQSLQQTVPTSATPEEQPQEKEASKINTWEIKKEGSLTLIGKECSTHCGIGIFDNGEEIEFYKVAKNNHTWEELIPRGVWEVKFNERIMNI